MVELVAEQCQTYFSWEPYSYDIPKKDIVRLVKKIVKKSKPQWEHLVPSSSTGRPPHSPEMMLSVLIYARIDQTEDANIIHKRIKHDNRYRYLCDGEIPSYTSIKDYRKKFRPILDEIHEFILDEAYNLGYTEFEHVSTDGSSFESYNSPQNVINEEDIDTLTKMYETCYMDKDIINSMKTSGKKFFNSNKPVDEKLELLHVYKEEVTNSNHDVTPLFDTDAKFMKNKKGYTMLGHNVQFVTDSKTKLIVAIHVSNEGSDAFLLPIAMDKALDKLPVKPKEVSADNSYRNEVSTEYLTKNEIIGYIPSTKQAKAYKGNLNQNPFHKDNMTYDYEKDVFICKNNQKLYLQKTELDKNEKREKRGLPLEVKRTYYNKEACASCPYKEDCFPKTSKYRIIVDTGSPETLEMQKRMDSPKGKKGYKVRFSTGETPIGIFKEQQNIRQINTTGSKNIEDRLMWDVIAVDIKILWNLGYM